MGFWVGWLCASCQPIHDSTVTSSRLWNLGVTLLNWHEVFFVLYSYTPKAPHSTTSTFRASSARLEILHKCRQYSDDVQFNQSDGFPLFPCVFQAPNPLCRSAIYRGGRRRRHWRNLGIQHDTRTTPDICDGKLIIILDKQCSTTTFVHSFPLVYHGLCYITVVSFLVYKQAFKLFKNHIFEPEFFQALLSLLLK